MNHAPRKLFALVATAILVGSCVGTEAPTGVGVEDVQFSVPISPALIPSPADAGARPINRIRARVSRVSDNTQLGEITVDVSPTDDEWEITVEARVRASGDTVTVFVYLINVAGAEETVEFSGLVGPIALTPGEIAEAADIPIVRGPIRNFFVTGVSITSAPGTMLEGQTATLEGEATTSGETAPEIFWTVLDSTILSSAEADVTALMPGTGRVVASAGSFADTASIIVTPAPASVPIDPDTATVIGIGAQATYQAAVVDLRGDTIVDETVVWGTQSPTVITALGDGLFEAIGVGTGVVTATSASDASVVGTAVMVVASQPADVSVAKSASVGNAQIGDTIDFEVVVTNASQEILVGVAVSDSVPAALTVESTNPAGAFDAGTGTWSWALDTLPPGAADTIVVRASVAPGTPDGTVTNVALVSPPAGFADPNTSDNRAVAAVDVAGIVGGPDVRVMMFANDSTPAEGDTVQVTVEVENLDVNLGAATTSLTVMNSAESGLTVVEATPDQGSFDVPSGVWTIGALAIDELVQLTLDVEVPVGASGQTLSDSAWVASITPAQSELSNDTASVELTVQERQVDVAVLKTVDDPQPLADSTVVFTVSVVNNSNGAVTDLAVFDTLAPGAFLAPQYAVSTGTLVNDSLWTIPTLAAGDTATWTTTTTTGPDVAGSSATNTAILRSIAQNDTTPANDTAVVAITFPFSAVPVVQITAPADGAVFDPGILVSFTGVANDPEQGDLSPSLAWVSDVDGALATGRSFETQSLSTGIHTISASATDQDGGTGADTIQITIALITAPTTLNVPFGGAASLPITLSEPAQAGGLTLTVSSADPATTNPTTSTVFIAGGALSANATLEGLQPGTTDVTISHPQFGSAITSVSVTAALNVLQTNLTVPETFPQSIDIQFESAGSGIAAPAGGLTVTLTSLDPTCVTAPASVQIAAGLVQQTATLSSAGSPQLPCTAWVRVTAPSIDPDSVNVTVTAQPTMNVNATTVGAGLQYGNFQVVLGTTSHGGATVRLSSSDPSVMQVSPNASTAGSDFIDVFVVNGQNRANYYVQGVEGQTGVVPLMVSAPGFTSNSADITVVQPGVDLLGLPTTLTTFSPDDIIQARIGVPNGNGISPVQAIRIGGTAVTATLSSDDVGVGDLVTLPDSASPVTVQIAPGASSSPSSVGAGGVAFMPTGVGVASVSTTIPGFVASANATRSVTVSAPNISVTGTTVGAGLQYGNFQAVLGATDHGGSTVRIASSDPAVMRISPDASTEGTDFIDVSVPNGQNRANYYVHGMEGQGGTATLQVSAPGFNSNNTAVITVVQPGVDLLGVNQTSLTTFSPDDPFQVRIGLPNASGFVSPQQAVRIGGTTLTATVTTTDPAVGQLITLPDSVAPVTVVIAPGQSASGSTVANGGIALDPGAEGSTTVAATIPGFVATTNASRDVPVTAPGLSVAGTTVGSGLQYGNFQVVLGATQHGGVTVRIQSSDPALMLVSPNVSTAGSPFIDVVVADGQNRANYYVQGMEGQTGTANLEVSAPGFTSNNNAVVTVVQPAYDISGLNTNGLTTFSPDDLFQVRVGPPFGATSISPLQAVRIGGTTLTATISSSNVGVGQLQTLTDVSSPVTVELAPGQSTSGNSIANGGVTLDALGSGSTTVSASIPGLIQQTNATQTVTVTAPALTVNANTVGSGLQYGTLSVILGATLHGGVTVTLTSSNPSVMLLSPNATTAGSASIDVFVADGQNRAYYYVQGVEGQTGIVGLTATAPGFTDGNNSITVVQPALDFVGLSSSYGAAANDDAFWARLGIPTTNDTDITIQQSIRFGGSPLTVTFTSSDPAVAQLVTSSTSGGSIQLQILPGQANTPTSVAAGGIAIDPLTAGSTFLEATVPGVITTTDGTRTVTITP